MYFFHIFYSTLLSNDIIICSELFFILLSSYVFTFALVYLKKDSHVFMKCRTTGSKYGDIDKIFHDSQNLSLQKLSQVVLTCNWKGHNLGQKLTQCPCMSSQMQSHDVVTIFKWGARHDLLG